MTDIASLGISVDSSDAKVAKSDLDNLATSAKNAEQATTSLGQKSQPGLGAIQAMAQRAGVSVQTMQQRISNFDLTKFQNQFKTASVTVAQNTQKISTASQSAVKQSINLAEQNGATSKSFQATGTSASKFVDILTRRFLLTYAVSQLRQVVSNLAAMNAEMAKIGNIGNLTNLGGATVQGLVQTAGGKGIDGDTIENALVAFNQQIPTAKAGIGSLGELLKANKVTVTDTADAFFKVADLVKNAASDTARLSILQQAGLPATLDMARYMAQGSDQLKDQIGSTTKLTDAQLDGAQKLADYYSKLWSDFESAGKRAIVSVGTYQPPPGGWVDKFMTVLSKIGSGIGTEVPTYDSSNPFNLPVSQGGGGYKPVPVTSAPLAAPKTTVDWATQKQIASDAISKQQQYIGLLGQTASVADQVKSAELNLQSASLNGVGVSASQSKAILDLARDRALGIDSMKAETDQLNVQAQTFGLSAGAAETMTLYLNRLNEATRNHQELTADDKASIMAWAEQAGQATQRLQDMKDASDLVSGGLKTFRDDLEQGKTVFQSLQDVALNVLNKISDKLIDMAAQDLVKNAFGGGGSFNLLSIFGLGGSSSIGGIGHAAAGGYITGPGGPRSDSIPTMLSNGEFVVNAAATSHFKPLLERINAVGMASGGSVPSIPRQSFGQSAVMLQPNFQVQVNNAPADTSANVRRQQTPDGAKIVIDLVKRHYANGGFDDVNSRYGLKPNKVR